MHNSAAVFWLPIPLQSKLPHYLKNRPDLVSAALCGAHEAASFIEGSQSTLSHRDIQTKHDGTPVTTIDRKSETIIKDHLRFAHPQAVIIGEESSPEEACTNQQQALFSPYWLIDPIDGTREFVTGGDNYVINIAWMSQENPESPSAIPVFGLILHPPSGDVVLGAKGAGVWAGSMTKRPSAGWLTPLESTKATENTPLRLIHGHARPPPNWYQTCLGKSEHDWLSSETMASARKMLMLLHQHVDVYLCHSKTMSWDVAAGQVLLQEIGGDIITRNGSSLCYPDPLASNQPFAAVRHTSITPRLNLKALAPDNLKQPPHSLSKHRDPFDH